jgi:hypothetical protein
MKTIFRMFVVVFLVLTAAPSLVSADFLDDALKKGLQQLPGIGGPQNDRATIHGLDEATVASGLKEALSLGTKNAVGLVSKLNGYFGNESIKILLPDKVQTAADLLGKIGYQKQVDDFIRSMNRAAEKAAPKAAVYFADSIKGMTIEDARNILSGSQTAATEYFQSKTAAKLYDEFKPQIAESMKQVEVARFYNDMMGKVPASLFTKPQSIDLDHYITNKALDGLFYMIAQEEQKIRENPVARTTDLLKKVFGK